jgi:hypothetical protein
VPCDDVDAAVVPTAVEMATKFLVAALYVFTVGVVGDNINTSEGAQVISIVISPYNEVSIIDVEALPLRKPSH